MIENSIEQRLSRLERDKAIDEKIHEEEDRQCFNHNERTSYLEEFMQNQKIENEKMKIAIERVGIQSERAVEKLRYGWLGHLIQAIIVIIGFIFIYTKIGGVK